jgi:hypothetical protein
VPQISRDVPADAGCPCDKATLFEEPITRSQHFIFSDVLKISPINVQQQQQQQQQQQ